MSARLVLLRGVNVGGNNKVPMADLRRCLEDLGFARVSTYIASGNALLESDEGTDEIRGRIDTALHGCFKLNELVRVAVLTREQLQAVIDDRPAGFGDSPNTYHSDAIFLMGITADEAMAAFEPREGVDRVWPGSGLVYSQRLSAKRTKSRLTRIVGSPLYPFMTIRSWGTVLALAELARQMDAAAEG